MKQIASQFQFQTGSIKRALKKMNPSSWKTFQFQTGSIKSAFGFNHQQKQPSFNSKLVRLKGWR